ncbi:putative membrane protein [Sinobacterium caligoides]|uniref:Putative membrane protein n=1 Tax=Sinobacterium caligoides TaxID=933926 RepID=A0A3N2DQE0_9GAMM|nr:DUF2269 domain-containing protein [Sinobacterium caligoides]ROS02051.1 putative membrane protein [Sinobacterium caligoides]
MDNYLLLKMIHILSAVIVTGTGAGIAFFMFMANRSNNIQAIAVTARHVVLADWLFTTPAIVVQFVTGLMLMMRLGYTFTSSWFLLVISLFLFIGACWVPVVVIQYRLRNLADSAVESGELGAPFKQMMRWWTALGVPAFCAILVIFWLMVFKPLPLT